MKSQITTKRGDKGETTALNGESYSKAHPIMDCVGGVDELRAHLVLARLLFLKEAPEERESSADFLLWILHACFVIGSTCSDPLNRRPEWHKNAIGLRHIEHIEAEQAKLETTVTLPKAFIVSASNALAAQIDLSCTVARRLERNIVRLKDQMPGFDAEHILVFVNRLSDYLFMLARYLDAGRYQTVDYSIVE